MAKSCACRRNRVARRPLSISCMLTRSGPAATQSPAGSSWTANLSTTRTCNSTPTIILVTHPANYLTNFSRLPADGIDKPNDVPKPAALDDKTREEIDELTHMLKGNLEKVVQHGKRAGSIVKNMLLHSREGSGEHRPVDINAIVEESLNLAYHGARAERSGFNITLRRDLDPEAGMIDPS